MLEKTYSPADIEARIHSEWEAADAFKAGRPERAGSPAYCIVIPPPNVTGSLHIGHALNNTLQDILCRYERLRGKDVLWQPGMDHAGIATQLVVSRQLAERQIQYKDLGREKFVEKVWEWKAESGGTILNQLKRLGASCDWSRERFTLDRDEAGQMSKAVLKVFVELYRAGLLYKDKRLGNWDPEFQSVISDLEVEPRDHTGSFKWSPDLKDKDGNPVPFDGAALAKVLARDPSGHMYYIRYPIEGSPGEFVTVGTTRPETMLGDTGVAIHPENEKLKHLIGKRAILPLVGRAIPIVGDTYADPEKGTGAVKITPAHDFNDWDVGKRCGLEVINILDAKARINENAPAAYRGLDRFAARAKVVSDLVALGVVEKIEPHTHAVPHAQRGDAVVEPWLTDQWYVDAATLAKPAMEAVRAGKTTFVPEKYAADYFRWLENIQPWCVSRQLWWGHRIPAWYGPSTIADSGPRAAEASYDPESDRLTVFHCFVAPDEADAVEQAQRKYRVKNIRVVDGPVEVMEALKKGQYAIYRDPDVLDTWFSSGLWPFSTLGWPEQTKELGRYYPTSCLVTGFDIIFFWVARMMMMGTHFMKEVPFHDVFIHGLVRDEKGRKMSKTLGNSIDPLELIDQYGADALRFTLAALTTQGRDVKISTQRVEGYRNFATKLWNAARFMEVNECRRVAGFDPKAIRHTLNRWIAGETERAVAAVETALKAYKFNEAAGAAYQFVWGVTCDWYLELAKPLLTGDDAAAKAETQATAAWVLDQILPLLHPFMPFVTEELWAKTGEHGPKRESMLALAAWPKLSGLADDDADAEIGWIVSLVSEVRSLRAEMNVPGGAKVSLVLVGASATTRARAGRHDETLKRLARLDAISFEDQAPKGAAQIVVGDTVAALPLAGIIDMVAEAKRLAKEIDKTVSEIKKVTDRLSNPQFMSKAPEEVIDELRERQSDFEARQGKLKAALARVEAAA